MRLRSGKSVNTEEINNDQLLYITATITEYDNAEECNKSEIILKMYTYIFENIDSFKADQEFSNIVKRKTIQLIRECSDKIRNLFAEKVTAIKNDFIIPKRLIELLYPSEEDKISDEIDVHFNCIDTFAKVLEKLHE
jgi:hypothetical protein